MQNFTLSIVLIMSSLFILSSCYYDKADKLYPSGGCDTTSVKYGADVNVILTMNCLNQGCHTAANPSGGFKFDTYANAILTIPSNKLLNSLNYQTGGSKNMPPSGKISDCNIRKINAWINRGFPNN